jgi:site-specific recombinase XerD
MIERAGLQAKLGFKPHPHMLRHACGSALANRGHDTRALQGPVVTGYPDSHSVRKSGG